MHDTHTHMYACTLTCMNVRVSHVYMSYMHVNQIYNRHVHVRKVERTHVYVHVYLSLTTPVLLPSSSTMMRLFGVAFAMMSCQKIQVSRVTTIPLS